MNSNSIIRLVLESFLMTHDQVVVNPKDLIDSAKGRVLLGDGFNNSFVYFFKFQFNNNLILEFQEHQNYQQLLQ